MGESWAAIDGDDGKRRSPCAEGFIRKVNLLSVGDAGGVRDGLGWEHGSKK
jgi:hypothetical protein